MDSTRLLIHPDARLEMLEAYDWYAERNQDAADSFLQEIEHAGKTITTSSKSWPAYLHGSKRYLLKHFPFSIIYREKDGIIEILAVAHQRRRPGYWKKRATEE